MIAQADSLGFRLLSQAQALSEKEQWTSSNEAALEAAVQFLEQKDWRNWQTAYEVLYSNARTTYTREDLQFAAAQLAQADSMLQHYKEVPLEVQAAFSGKTAYLFHDLGDYPMALKYYEKAFVPAEQVEDPTALLSLYASASNVMWFLGDDYRALNYQEKALKLATNPRHIAYIKRSMGNVWRTLDPHRAIPLYLESLDLEPDNSETWMLLSKAYLEGPQDLAKAMEAAQKSWALSDSDFAKSDAAHQIGKVYFAQKAYDSAISQYRNALHFAEGSYGIHHPEAAKIHVFIGNAYLAKRSYTKALQAYNQSLEQLLPLFQPRSEKENPTKDQLTNFSLWILEALQGKSKAFAGLYQQNKQGNDQEMALATAELSVLYLLKLKSIYTEDASKYEINDAYLATCNQAMDMAFDLADASTTKRFYERAFNLSNQTKAIVLTESLFRKEVKQQSGIPDSLLSLERDYHQTITGWERKLQDLDPGNAIQPIKDSLFLAKRKLEDLESYFETAFPSYAHAKFEYRQTQPVPELQSELSDSAVLIEYFLSERFIYAFFISRDSFWTQATPKSEAFNKQLHAFLRTINDWDFVSDSSTLASTIYLENGRQLYLDLLGPTPLPPTIKRLIIIPDKELALLPFELLLTEPYPGKWTDRAVPFLLKEQAISYRFSSGQRSRRPTGELGSWGGYGIEFEDFPDAYEDELNGLALRKEGRLPFADDEVRTIAAFFGGKTWLSNAATRTSFMEHAEQYGILHLATHGIIDPDDPLRSKLLFSRSIYDQDPAVYAHEIYGMQLKAGLAVLSACSSGAGTWKNGEGVMSLARAFSFAGCPSVVMSLWNVADRSTADIMTDFYKNLQQGMLKDKALQQAKLQYLQNTSAAYAKPIFWGSFVVIGETDSIPIEAAGTSLPVLPWVLIGLFVILVLIWFSRKRFKRD
ncbi:MAG: CHAT domain-containing protein [Phaeodactylibacter sp.]|nr:CHAT domain-containing protein [Phaeodactylibacter sp.]